MEGEKEDEGQLVVSYQLRSSTPYRHVVFLTVKERTKKRIGEKVRLRSFHST